MADKISLPSALKEAIGISKPAQWLPASELSYQQPYLTGLRGILVLQSILWIFFQTFVPTVVPNNETATPGPQYQKVLRDFFSPLLWNETLIASFFIALSGRSICLRFLTNAGPATFAGTIIRRTVRMGLSLAFASGLAMGILKATGTSYIDEFKSALPNLSIATPGTAGNGLIALNSMFDLFWVTQDFSTQAANTFWPSATLWAPSVIYFQGFTTFMLMVILPYTRLEWHTQGLGLFALGAFWMDSWGWFSAAALLLANQTVNPALRRRLIEGLNITENFKLPFFIPAAAMTILGFAFKYLWTVFPQYVNKMLVLHPYLDISEETTVEMFAAAGVAPRLDNFLVIFGVLLLVDSTPKLQSVLSARPLLYLGERSFSFFVAQSIIFWTAGIKLWLHLRVGQHTSVGAANAGAFFVSVLVTIAFAELYHRVIDLPSRFAAKTTFDWLLD